VQQDCFQPNSACPFAGDANLQYQQNLMVRKIAILLLSTNHWPTLKGQVALVQSALDKVRPGEFVRVEVQRRE